MSKYEKIKQDNEALQSDDTALFELAARGMEEITDDAKRRAEIYAHPEQHISEIDQMFMDATQLDRTDVIFLFIATALQIGRWIIIGEISKHLDAKIDQNRTEHNDKSIKDMEKKKRNEYTEKHEQDGHVKSDRHRDWQEIIWGSVPYDITHGCNKFYVDTTKISMEGGYHRLHTLGHDPILGWLFGVVNILSDTITLDKTYKCKTFNVDMRGSSKQWTSETTLGHAFCEAYDSIKEDKNRLPAAVFAQAVHLKSDISTKFGLPMPILESVAPQLESKLYKEGYDTLYARKELGMAGVQAATAIVINMLISLIHGLFYNPELHHSRDLYEVKTRKILSYSNLIADSLNIAVVTGMEVIAGYTGNEELARKGVSELDIGGIIVTMIRLVTDTVYISKVKADFLQKEWSQEVIGNEYSFLREVEVMSKKDVQKGIEIQAQADAAAALKVADGLEAHAEVMRRIESNQSQVRAQVGTVIDDMVDEEARKLYSLGPSKKPVDLDRNERRALCAAVYTLMSSHGQNNDDQKAFYVNLEGYLGVSERVDSFDFMNLNHIDSHADRVTALRVLCAFLFLHDCTTGFVSDEAYAWLYDFASRKDVEVVCAEIEKEYSILDAQGIVSSYRTIGPTDRSYSSEVCEETAPEIASEQEKQDDLVRQDDFSQLKEIVDRYTSDENSFGKKSDKPGDLIRSELASTFPSISCDAVLAATRIANGCLFFTTNAIYFRVGLLGGYVKIPYRSIQIDRMTTEQGFIKNARKLVISYSNAEGSEEFAYIDDLKVTEEKLRDLLTEIVTSGCSVSVDDSIIHLTELPENHLKLFLSSMAYVLCSHGRCLTELYYVVEDLGLAGKWNEVVCEINTEDDAIHTLEAFKGVLPPISKTSLLEEASTVFMQTIVRTNLYENKAPTALTTLDEITMKCLFTGQDSTFNAKMSGIKQSTRSHTHEQLNELKAAIIAAQPLYEDRILIGINDGIAVLEKKEAEEHEREQKKANMKKVLSDTTSGVISTAKNGLSSAWSGVKSKFGTDKKE